jgi:hypothetical protein
MASGAPKPPVGGKRRKRQAAPPSKLEAEVAALFGRAERARAIPETKFRTLPGGGVVHNRQSIDFKVTRGSPGVTPDVVEERSKIGKVVERAKRAVGSIFEMPTTAELAQQARAQDRRQARIDATLKGAGRDGRLMTIGGDEVLVFKAPKRPKKKKKATQAKGTRSNKPEK